MSHLFQMYHSSFPPWGLTALTFSPLLTSRAESTRAESRESEQLVSGHFVTFRLPGLLGTMGSPFTGLPGQPAPAKELTVPFLPKSVFGDVTSVAFSRRWGGGGVFTA